jgi:hypothetical protein
MEIFFRSKKLQKLCSSETNLRRELGKQRATKLQQRLLELQAAANLADI